MTGSPAIATWIAQVVFWAVLAVGVLTDSLSLRVDIALVLVVVKGDVRLS